MNDTVYPGCNKNYSKNVEKASFYSPCVICGKPVKNTKKAHFVNVIGGGSEFGTPDADPNDPGFMGAFPVGPECWRQYKNELSKFATK